LFRLSRGSEYAIRGILHLALEPVGKISFIEEIAEAQEVPKAYLAKIFQTLCKKGFLKSTRGPGGGFALIKSASDISMLEIIEAMEGPINLNDCLIRKGYCSREKRCPVHDVWRDAQDRFLDYLRNCSFQKLADDSRVKQAAAGL